MLSIKRLITQLISIEDESFASAGGKLLNITIII